MDELEKLLKLVADGKKEEAEKLSKKIKEKIDSLDSEVNRQEGLKLDAIKARDEVKSKLKKVASDLGVGEIDDVSKAIEAIKSKKGGDNSKDMEVKDNEIKTLKAEITTANETLESEKGKHKQEIMSVALEKDIAKILPKYKAKAGATNYIIDAVKKNAVYEDGKVLFKNENGTTMRINGSDATLEDMISDMQKKEKDSKESIFFQGVQESVPDNDKGGKLNEKDFQP